MSGRSKAEQSLCRELKKVITPSNNRIQLSHVHRFLRLQSVWDVCYLRLPPRFRNQFDIALLKVTLSRYFNGWLQTQFHPSRQSITIDVRVKVAEHLLKPIACAIYLPQFYKVRFPFDHVYYIGKLARSLPWNSTKCSSADVLNLRVGQAILWNAIETLWSWIERSSCDTLYGARKLSRLSFEEPVCERRWWRSLVSLVIPHWW